jgi:hypothetical protein
MTQRVDQLVVENFAVAGGTPQLLESMLHALEVSQALLTST